MGPGGAGDGGAPKSRARGKTPTATAPPRRTQGGSNPRHSLRLGWGSGIGVPPPASSNTAETPQTHSTSGAGNGWAAPASSLGTHGGNIPREEGQGMALLCWQRPSPTGGVSRRVGGGVKWGAGSIVLLRRGHGWESRGGGTPISNGVRVPASGHRPSRPRGPPARTAGFCSAGFREGARLQPPEKMGDKMWGCSQLPPPPHLLPASREQGLIQTQGRGIGGTEKQRESKSRPISTLMNHPPHQTTPPPPQAVCPPQPWPPPFPLPTEPRGVRPLT